MHKNVDEAFNQLRNEILISMAKDEMTLEETKAYAQLSALTWEIQASYEDILKKAQRKSTQGTAIPKSARVIILQSK